MGKIKSPKIFSNALLCIFLISVAIMGGIKDLLGNPNSTIANSVEKPELRCYTAAEINPKGASYFESDPKDASSCQSLKDRLDEGFKILEEGQIEKVSSEELENWNIISEKEPIQIYSALSGHKLILEELQEIYRIEYDGKTFLLPKNSINSFTLSYFKGILYLTKLTESPDKKTLKFEVLKNEFEDKPKGHFDDNYYNRMQFYFKLLENNFIVPPSKDCPPIVGYISRCIHDIQILLRDQTHDVLPLIKKNIDKFPYFFPYMFRRGLINILKTDHKFLLNKDTLDKLFAPNFRGKMYDILQKAAARFQKDPYNVFPYEFINELEQLGRR